MYMYNITSTKNQIEKTDNKTIDIIAKSILFIPFFLGNIYISIVIFFDENMISYFLSAILIIYFIIEIAVLIFDQKNIFHLYIANLILIIILIIIYQKSFINF